MMKHSLKIMWEEFRRFLYGTFSIYILFYVFFLSDYSHLLYLNFIGVEITSWINQLVLHKEFPGFVPTADFYWAYIASISFFTLAILCALIWSLLSRKKIIPLPFLELAIVVARYFIAFQLLFYGIEKLDGVQFTIQAERLIPSVGSTDAFNLFWISTGSSESYTFFGGLLETIAAILLLFRKTTVLACLIAIPVLSNILLINIGFDIFIKLKSFHLLLFCIFILNPDINRMYKFFILKQNSSLTLPPPPLLKAKYSWVQNVLKYVIIGFMVFSIIKDEIYYYNRANNSTFEQLVGIFNITDFHITKSDKKNDYRDSLRWKK